MFSLSAPDPCQVAQGADGDQDHVPHGTRSRCLRDVARCTGKGSVGSGAALCSAARRGDACSGAPLRSSPRTTWCERELHSSGAGRRGCKAGMSHRSRRSTGTGQGSWSMDRPNHFQVIESQNHRITEY